MFRDAVLHLVILASALARASAGWDLEVHADFLKLHVAGRLPAAAAAIQYRLAELGEIAEDAKWLPAPVAPSPGQPFRFQLPLPRSCWSRLELRALAGDQVLSQEDASPKADPFKMLTPERLAALPEDQRRAWMEYLERSRERFRADFNTLAAECRALGMPSSRSAPDTRHVLELDSDAPREWFVRPDTRRLAAAVLSYQTPAGGWSKSIDYGKGPRQKGTHWTSQGGEGWHYCGTIDNRATTEQIKLLAGVWSATQDEGARRGALRGLEYLLEAQYPNGGWPQNYPLESGYHEAITLNDNAMTHVMEVLLLVSEGRAPFEWTEESLRQRARAALDRGIACLAAAQVKVDGQLTVWCAQHDPLSLSPVRARSKEPPSLSGAESAEWLRFLLRKAPVTGVTTAMIQPALDWLESHRLEGLRKTENAAGKTDYVEDASSTELYWARFYDLQSGKPVFPGARDGVLYSTYSEMASRNPVNYDFLTSKPRDLLEKEAPRWRKRMERER